MYGFICKEGVNEWRVRRKEEGKNRVLIVREYMRDKTLSEYPVNYVLSKWSQTPKKVKEVAKELKERIPTLIV